MTVAVVHPTPIAFWAVTVKDIEAEAVTASATRTVKVARPGAVAVPVTAPVVESESPAGSEPETTVYTYGAVPLVAVSTQTAPDTAFPTMGFGRAVFVMVGAALSAAVAKTTRDNDFSSLKGLTPAPSMP